LLKEVENYKIITIFMNFKIKEVRIEAFKIISKSYYNLEIFKLSKILNFKNENDFLTWYDDNKLIKFKILQNKLLFK
jgi:hypothetical protein